MSLTNLRNVLTDLQVRFLLRIAPPVPLPIETPYDGKSKLVMLLGRAFLESLREMTVLDFGCGEGHEVVEMARAGARNVVGLENREPLLKIGRDLAVQAGVESRCEFTSSPGEPVDVIVSLDSFEHFDDPEGVLRTMHALLRPGGYVMASWGPPWYHPYGAHLLELPPWMHVFFTERAIMKWRSHMRQDGATCYRESEGGLNQMTVSRFERIVKNSGFRIESLDVVPIRKLKFLHNRFTREFTTSVVRCRLRKP